MEQILSRVVIGQQGPQDPIVGYQQVYEPVTGQWLIVPLSEQSLATWLGNILSVPEPYKGTITKVVIRKDSSDLSTPASLKVGDSCELHGFGRLDASSVAVRCGMRATVTKPDTTQLSGKYEMSTKQDPGQELRFSIMNISVDKAGSWSAVVEYYAIY
jgi:hypothetical protein